MARAEAGVRALASQLDELKAGSRTQEVARAKQAMQSAASVMEDAKRNAERYENLFRKGTVSEKERDTVRLRYETALREYERSREAYDLAREGSRAETIRTAEARLAEGEALLKQARSNLGRIETARKEVEAARALVAAARAALDQAAIQLDYTRLTAPRAGVITSRSIEPGEVVTPGREVLTLSELATVDLKIFVDETQIGKVKPGQKAEVRIDTFPERTFAGTVTFISPEGEFTPKIIQTQEGTGQAGLSRQGVHPQPRLRAQIRDARRCLVTIKRSPTSGSRGSPAVSATSRRSATSPLGRDRERSSASSAPTGRGNPPSCGWRRRCSDPPRAGSRSAVWMS